MTNKLIFLTASLVLAGCTDPIALDAGGSRFEGLATPALPGQETDGVDPIYETPEEALVTDIAIAAVELGYSEEQVARKIAFQDNFREFVRSVVERYPEQIAGVWTDEIPNIGGHIVFTGDVPEDVRVDGAWLSLLDASQVELTGNAVMPMGDGMRHAELAHEALLDEGHTNFLTYYDVKTQSVQVEFQRAPGAEHPVEEQIAGVVRDRVVLAASHRDDRLLVDDANKILDTLNVRMKVISRDGEIFDLHHARGGNLVTGASSCTSGWTVNGPNGDGFVTAGHCTGISQLIEEGGTINTATWRSQINGLTGDAEYHTTNHTELAEFFASAGSIRDVDSLWDGAWSGIWPFIFQEGVGDSVCQYGRFSNSRSCNKTVQEVGITVTFTDGTTRGNLARTNNPTSVAGDSGGGWSFSTKAFGVHSGASPTDAFFTPVVYVEAGLGVTILTQ